MHQKNTFLSPFKAPQNQCKFFHEMCETYSLSNLFFKFNTVSLSTNASYLMRYDTAARNKSLIALSPLRQIVFCSISLPFVDKSKGRHVLSVISDRSFDNSNFTSGFASRNIKSSNSFHLWFTKPILAVFSSLNWVNLFKNSSLSTLHWPSSC